MPYEVYPDEGVKLAEDVDPWTEWPFASDRAKKSP